MDLQELQLERERLRARNFRTVVVASCILACTFIKKVDLLALIALFQ
ncbi:hypothetical protein N0B44_23455 [Roseibacterium beibuensis]|nr:hypothetical protein [Roseibacterium beibuensis]MCS6625877.1 hypothetical protein [Roseibacterium beibuensis]